jgi:hypothetical protein
MELSFVEEVTMFGVFPNGTNDYNHWSPLFASWVTFYYYGLKNSKNLKLFQEFSVSPYKDSITTEWFDVSNFMRNERKIFPWYQRKTREPDWYPSWSCYGVDEPAGYKTWIAHMNFWVQLCFNNGYFIVTKGQHGLQLTSISTRPFRLESMGQLRGFGFLEDFHDDYPTPRKIAKYRKRNDSIYSYPDFYVPGKIKYFFLYGPASLMNHSNDSNYGFAHIEPRTGLQYAHVLTYSFKPNLMPIMVVHLEGTLVDERELENEIDRVRNYLQYSIVISKVVVKSDDAVINFGEEIVVKYSTEFLTFET